jgi:signal transduction histidine kinase
MLVPLLSRLPQLHSLGQDHEPGVYMLIKFLKENRKEIITMTEKASMELAGLRPSSEQLVKGLPIFYEQLIGVLIREQTKPLYPTQDIKRMKNAADNNDIPAMSKASGHPEEEKLAKSAGSHGLELLRLGYTLSHVVHAYGSICQSITELATLKKITITAVEFHDLNRCLDVAIAGAVTEFQKAQNAMTQQKEIEHLGALAHELRNELLSINLSFQIIKRGAVGVGGNTGRIIEDSLKRIQMLVDKSLTEVRLRVDPKIHVEEINVLQFVSQLSSTFEMYLENQKISVAIDPSLCINADQQLLFSALSNLVQNALKFSQDNANIKIRASKMENYVVIEVEDECGGLNDSSSELFKPFVQRNENKIGLGLGLTIAEKAVLLNKGKIEFKNIPGQGCIFRIILPRC